MKKAGGKGREGRGVKEEERIPECPNPELASLACESSQTYTEHLAFYIVSAHVKKFYRPCVSVNLIFSTSRDKFLKN